MSEPEKPIKPVFEEEELKYPIILIPTLNEQGKRSLAVGFGFVPPEPEYRDTSQLGMTELQMLSIALGGRVPVAPTRRSMNRLVAAPTRRYPAPQANRHGRILGWAPIQPRQGIAGDPATSPQPTPTAQTAKGRKARQKLLEKKLAARKAKA